MADELLITTPLGFRAAGDERLDLTWTVSKLTGWFERAGVKSERSSRAWGDGDYSAPSFREAKLPAFEGLCFSRSGAEQHHFLQMLEAQLGNGEMTRFTVQGAAGTTWADAKLDSEPTFEMGLYGRTLRYRATMYVPSGYRYGDLREYASGERAYHRGTAEAVPRFVVTGAMPSGYRIQAGGLTFTVTQALAAGQTHTIDFADGGMVYRNGVLQRGVYAHPRQMWTVPRGIGIVHTLAPISGTGTLKVQLTDTY
ncbi:hypothetical protein GCM10010910_01420 [Microbacterium nanhaiense]|uniref:Phage tail protein n=1 Tax=Microbacterium nanhaiense TaxID=1301026 RepID=A0ABQ2MV15_9MICO|nr:hypothetical protein [Microbacterium nanhaiense]GGO59146.1 hypothetical protein GCM10010910_01420 [Microbacterium nanhaiense]